MDVRRAGRLEKVSVLMGGDEYKDQATFRAHGVRGVQWMGKDEGERQGDRDPEVGRWETRPRGQCLVCNWLLTCGPPAGMGEPWAPSPARLTASASNTLLSHRGSYIPGCGRAGRCSPFTQQQKHEWDRACLPRGQAAGLPRCSTGPVSPSGQILLFPSLSVSSARPLPHITATVHRQLWQWLHVNQDLSVDGNGLQEMHFPVQFWGLCKQDSVVFFSL